MRRFLLLSSLVLVCAATTQARDPKKKEDVKQETKVVDELHRGLQDRIDHPDTRDANVNSAQGKMFDTKAFSGNKVVSTRDFYFDQKVQTKSFLTRLFWGSKTNRDANKMFATAAANTKGKYEIPNATTTIAQNQYATKEAAAAGKKFATSAFSTREAVVRGTAQGSIDEQYQHGPLTFDQVRDLLNKNQ